MEKLKKIVAWSLRLKGDISRLGREGEPFIIELPLISPNALNRRIRIENNIVSAIVRRTYFQLREDVMKEGRDAPLYLYGPRGVGKSYLLYILATDLAIGQRSFRPDTRVTYINDCQTWILGNHNFFLTELIVTFASDDGILNVLPRILAIRETFDELSRQNQILELLSELENFVIENNFRWFIIFDQLNAFHDGLSLSATAALALRIVMMLAKCRSRNVIVLGSASANNETYPVEFLDWDTFPIELVPNRYDEREFELWCKRNDFKQTDDSDSTRELLYYTGGIPLELDVCNGIKADSFRMKLKEYKSNRLESLILSHRKFCQSLTSHNDQRNLKECIGRMALCLSPPNHLVGMDQHLLFVEGNQVHEKRIVALFPLARTAVTSHNSEIIQDSLKLVAEIVFKDQRDYPNDVKGRVVERYIITSLEQNRHFNFICRKAAARLGGVGASFRGEIHNVIYFDGILLPIRSTIPNSSCSLIVPTSTEYPGIDFFIWDPTVPQQVLLAVQVTAQKSLKEHMQNCKFKRKEWCRFLGIQEASIRALWMAPKECIDVREGVNNGLDNYILDFDTLVDLCPQALIHHFKRGIRESALSRNTALASAAAGGGSDFQEHVAGDQVRILFLPTKPSTL